MNYLEQISFGIKQLRKQANLTQEQFAEKLDMSIQGVRNIEQAKYSPTAKTIDKICTVFKIKPVELFLFSSNNELWEVQECIMNKIKTCNNLEKLIKVNSMLDII